jgi:hypothetical protein
MKLYEITDQYNNALNELLYNEDIPQDAAIDTLEALEGELVAKGQNVAAFILNLNYDIETLKAHEKTIAAKRKAMESKQEWLREYLLTKMMKSGITEIKAIDGSFKVKFSEGRESVVIDNDELIDERFLKVKTEVSKSAIQEAIKNGEAVKGAHIEKKPYITIK